MSWDVTSAYDSFLLEHGPRIASIESSLRTLTWLLPGRFQDAEVASEAVCATMNLVSSYHDSVLRKLAKSIPLSERRPASSHQRYVISWMETSTSYRVAARTLATVQYLQLLVEMVARKRLGAQKRWRVVLGIEIFKAALRLALVHITHGRPTISPPVPEREVDPNLVMAKSALSHDQDNNRDNVIEESDSWTGKRTGKERRRIANIRNEGDINDFLVGRVLGAEDAKSANELVRRIDSRLVLAGELVWIVRPVLYVLAIDKYGLQSNEAFGTAFALEWLWRTLRERSSVPAYFQSDLERRETEKRRAGLWWYLLRGPGWRNIGRPALEGVASRLENTVGAGGGFVREYVGLIDELYYYVS